jgi:hypothetical protein
MGFYLHGLLVLSESAVALYDRIVPGAGGLALPTSRTGLPSGFFLPLPWALVGVLMEAPGWFSDAEPSLWRARIGLPCEDDPEQAFDLRDCRLASFVSLASPQGALLLTAESIGDALECEYAATFKAGVLCAAAGVSHGDERSYVLERTAYTSTVGPLRPGPTERCAALLDPRFAGASLYDDYLPRNAGEGLLAPRSGRVDWGEIIALERAVDTSWEAWFPNLRASARPRRWR